MFLIGPFTMHGWGINYKGAEKSIFKVVCWIFPPIGLDLYVLLYTALFSDESPSHLDRIKTGNNNLSTLMVIKKVLKTQYMSWWLRMQEKETFQLMIGRINYLFFWINDRNIFKD